MVGAYFLQLSVKWIIVQVTFVLAESQLVRSFAVWPVLNWILLQLPLEGLIPKGLGEGRTYHLQIVFKPRSTFPENSRSMLLNKSRLAIYK